MILIISKPSDEHAAVIFQILKSMQVDVEILDLSNYPQAMNLSMLYNGNKPQYLLMLENGRKIDVGAVKSIWWRRPQTFELHPELKRTSHRTFAFNEAHEAFTGLWHNLNAHWINHPAKDDIAQRKAHQLQVAGEIGFEIPQTLITSNPDDAKQFLKLQGAENTIYKSFSATMQEWRETRLVKEKELSLLENVKYTPVIFQEYIEAEADIRITVIGDKIFPAAIYSQQSAYKYDFRMDMNNATVEATQLPKDIEIKIKNFMNRMGLIYGAIDMRLTPKGRYVFLEINPAGQWLFIEERTGQKISEALAQNLMNGCIG